MTPFNMTTLSPSGSPKYFFLLTRHMISIIDKTGSLRTGMSLLEKNQSGLINKTNNSQLAQADRGTCEIRIFGIPFNLAADSAFINRTLLQNNTK